MIDGLVEERDIAPLHVAVKRGLTDGVEILLKYNADLNVQSQDGYTPLMMACAVSWCIPSVIHIHGDYLYYSCVLLPYNIYIYIGLYSIYSTST